MSHLGLRPFTRVSLHQGVGREEHEDPARYLLANVDQALACFTNQKRRIAIAEVKFEKISLRAMRQHESTDLRALDDMPATQRVLEPDP